MFNYGNFVKYFLFCFIFDWICYLLFDFELIGMDRNSTVQYKQFGLLKVKLVWKVKFYRQNQNVEDEPLTVETIDRYIQRYIWLMRRSFFFVREDVKYDR